MFHPRKAKDSQASQEQENAQANSTPRLIHFIWVGPKPLPCPEVLEAWRNANPDCQVVLWVDKAGTDAAVFEHYQQDYSYQECSDMEKLSREQRQPKTDGAAAAAPPIVFADIHKNKVMTKNVRYEIDRFKPNYGCASDLLRLDIVSRFGGCYSDVDIDPGSQPLSESGCFDTQKPVFLVPDYSQNEEGSIGNDFFIASPGHPTVALLRTHVYQNYEGESTEVKQLNQPDRYDDENASNVYGIAGNLTSREFCTICRTGPEAFQVVLGKQGYLDHEQRLKRKGPDEMIGREYYRPHTSNAGSWLGMRIKQSNSVGEAVQRANETVIFEIRTMGMQRFAQSASDACRSLQIGLVKAVEAEALKKVNLQEDYFYERADFAHLNRDEVQKQCENVAGRALSDLMRRGDGVNKKSRYHIDGDYRVEKGFRVYDKNQFTPPLAEDYKVIDDVERVVKDNINRKIKVILSAHGNDYKTSKAEITKKIEAAIVTELMQFGLLDINRCLDEQGEKTLADSPAVADALQEFLDATPELFSTLDIDSRKSVKEMNFEELQHLLESIQPSSELVPPSRFELGIAAKMHQDMAMHLDLPGVQCAQADAAYLEMVPKTRPRLGG